MSTSSNTDAPALQRVAQEERELLAKIEEARATARRVVEEATAQAQTILDESQAAIAHETAEMRHASEREAAKQLTAVREKTDALLAETQDHAQRQAKQVAEEVLSRILPGQRKRTP
ncbi:MAG: V-type ATPase subunit subunit G family protein [Candidatus Hydrogenedentota bacterium]